MINSGKYAPEFISWEVASDIIAPINPKLAELINALSVSKKYPLIRLRQTFGDIIVNHGNVSLPDKFAAEIAYSTIPLFMSIDKHLEVFVENNERVIPLNIIKEGELVGLFETVDSLLSNRSPAPWCVSVGSRTLCMLARITDQLKYQKLAFKYSGLTHQRRITMLQDHWHLFKALANSSEFGTDWHTDILIFTASWFDRKKNDSKEWQKLYDYIYEQAWGIAKFAFFHVNIELQWENFIAAISHRRLKPNPYIADTIKHLCMLNLSKLPGFIPVNNTQKLMPDRELKRIFVEEYDLQKYKPTIMHAAPLDTINKDQSIYYSLAYPTLLGGSPSASTNKTRMMDLRDIMVCLDTIFKANDDSFLQPMQFNYFHADKDQHNMVQSSNTLPSYDQKLVQYDKNYADREFPAVSQFWNGCIALRQTK